MHRIFHNSYSIDWKNYMNDLILKIHQFQDNSELAKAKTKQKQKWEEKATTQNIAKWEETQWQWWMNDWMSDSAQLSLNILIFMFRNSFIKHKLFESYVYLC